MSVSFLLIKNHIKGDLGIRTQNRQEESIPQSTRLNDSAVHALCHFSGKHLFNTYFKRRGICSQLIASKILNNSVRLAPCFLENKQLNKNKTTTVCFLMTTTFQILS